MEKKYGAFFSSSADPQKLSTTVEASMKTAAGLLVFLGLLTSTDANSLIEQVGILVPLGYAAWNSGEIIFGLFRKIFVSVTEKLG